MTETPRSSVFARVPPHAVRHDVLLPDDHAGLIEWMLGNDAGFEASRVTGGIYKPDGRNCRSSQADASWKEAMSARIDALVPDLMVELGVAPFERGGFEIECVAYGDGGFIRKHRDTATRNWRHPRDRWISVVYYLHREPKGYSGGDLRLHALAAGADGVKASIDLPPRQNALIAFPSWAVHEVLPVRVPSGRYEDSRFAINFWVSRVHD
jgi:SM-20-related protein